MPPKKCERGGKSITKMILKPLCHYITLMFLQHFDYVRFGPTFFMILIRDYYLLCDCLTFELWRNPPINR